MRAAHRPVGRRGRRDVPAGPAARRRRGRAAAASTRDAEVTVIANTADDIWLHGLKVCPDLDTVMYTLGDGIDPERGWGRRDETWSAKEELRGVRRRADLVRPRRPRPRDPPGPHPDARRRLPALARSPRRCAGAGSPDVRLLPMTDDRVETHVAIADPESPSGRRVVHFQEYWVRLHAEVPAEAVVVGRARRVHARPRRDRRDHRRRPRAACHRATRWSRSARSSASRGCARRWSRPGPGGRASPRSSAAPTCAAWPTSCSPRSGSRSPPAAVGLALRRPLGRRRARRLAGRQRRRGRRRPGARGRARLRRRPAADDRPRGHRRDGVGGARPGPVSPRDHGLGARTASPEVRPGDDLAGLLAGGDRPRRRRRRAA